jgi:hypothetical protein
MHQYSNQLRIVQQVGLALSQNTQTFINVFNKSQEYYRRQEIEREKRERNAVRRYNEFQRKIQRSRKSANLLQFEME